MSFPPLLEDSPKIVKDIWKWKDIVLDDGRDYFVPRLQALKALSDVLVGSSHKDCVLVVECVILSTCVRMDILLSANSSLVCNQSTEPPTCGH